MQGVSSVGSGPTAVCTFSVTVRWPPVGHQEAFCPAGDLTTLLQDLLAWGRRVESAIVPLGLSSVASVLSQVCGTVGQQPRWALTAHSSRGTGDPRAQPGGEQRWRELSAQRRGCSLPAGLVSWPSCPTSCPLPGLKPQTFRPPHFQPPCLSRLRGPVLTGQGDKRPSSLWFCKLERKELHAGSD